MLPSAHGTNSTQFSTGNKISNPSRPDLIPKSSNTLHGRQQSEASINSSDCSMDQAFFSHNTSFSSTYGEEIFKSDDDHTNPNIQLCQRIQSLEETNQVLATEHAILTSTNCRLNRDLELFSEPHTKSGILSELRNRLAFTQMELETRDQVIADLKSTIAQQFCALQEPHSQVVQLQRNLREFQLDLQSCQKSEKWALNELHRTQQIKAELQQKVLRLEHEQCIAETRAARSQERINASSQHAVETQKLLKKENQLLQKQLIDNQHSKLIEKTTFSEKKVDLVCADCFKMKCVVEDVEHQCSLLNKTIEDSEHRRTEVEQQNGRLQSEAVVLSTLLNDQTVILNTIQEYVRRLELKKIATSLETNDLHGKVEDYKSQLCQLNLELDIKRFEIERLDENHTRVVNDLNLNQNKLAFQLKGTEQILKQVKLEKQNISEQLNNILDEKLEPVLNGEKTYSFELPNTDKLYTEVIPICQTDVIDLNFKLIPPLMGISDKVPKITQTQSDEIKHLKVLIRVLQTEHEEKTKRYETHIHNLIHKAKTHMRLQSISESVAHGMSSECDRLKSHQQRFNELHVHQEEKIFVLYSELNSLRISNEHLEKCIAELQVNFNRMTTKLSNAVYEKTKLQNILVDLRKGEKDTIRMKCETDDVKCQSLTPFRSKLDLLHIRDVLKRANTSKMSLDQLAQSVTDLHREVDSVVEVVREKYQPPSLMEELGRCT